MVSNAKLYIQLDALEAELLELIVPHLQRAANGENDLIFCVKQFNAFPELKHKTDKVTEELVEMGSSVISLREKLSESTKGTIAERICWYCREWGNTVNRDKNSGIRLAKLFLLEIEEQ